MIVIATKTEDKLRSDLRQFAISRPNQICFLLKFSKTDVEKGELFETFLRLLETIPNSYTARVYLCQDKDIVIMMENFMQRQFEGFVKKLAEVLEEPDFSDIVDVFEIGTQWKNLEAFYSLKIDEVEQDTVIKKMDELKNKTDKNVLDALSNLDAQLMDTVDARRKERSTIKVMVADDDQLSRTLAGNVLRGDYDLAFAHNGKEALQEYISAAPDILFLDIGMPDIGGHEVLESLFQIDPNAYIIMFSGRKDKGTIMKSLEMGAQGFLGKPFTREQLYMHVNDSPFSQIKRGETGEKFHAVPR